MQRFECSLTTQYMVVQPRGYMYHIPNVACAKEVCNRAVTYQPALARKSRKSILALWSKTELDPVKSFCLAPDVKVFKTNLFCECTILAP